MKKKITMIVVILALCLGLAACNKNDSFSPNAGGDISEYIGGNTYTEITEQPFVEVTEDNNKSIISLSCNTASYSDLRRQILSGARVSKDAVKIEEMINYFSYDYPSPSNGQAMSMSAAIMDTPWNSETKLMMVGLKAEEIAWQSVENNIVLLLDVSGSMFGGDRLGLVIQSFSALVDQLSQNDKVSVVTYASSEKVLLKGVSGDKKDEIKSALSNLTAGGSTAGGSAIQKAYDIATEFKTESNRTSIIIATDGDFNVGISNPTRLKAMISEYRDRGIYLSAVGVGMGNMRSDMLESMADKGGGRHVYLSNMTDANKFFVEELGGILNIVAKDAKAQIEFNIDRIAEYRMIGYENRTLSLTDWEDPSAQAGSIGSGTTVTAVYEVKLKEGTGNFAELTLRYKNPDTDENKEESLAIGQKFLNPLDNDLNNEDFEIIRAEDRAFISAVVETGLLLRDSAYKGTASYANVYGRIAQLDCVKAENDAYKNDFLKLVEILKG